MPEDYRQPGIGATPHLFVSNATKAIEFYRDAFGAEELSRHMAPDGKRVMHAALRINGGTVMLNDDFPEYRGGKGSTPEDFGGSPVVLHLQVQEVDPLFERAVQAGGTVVFPLQDQFWGDRYGQIRDPFGHVWSIGAPIRSMSSSDIEEAAKPHFK